MALDVEEVLGVDAEVVLDDAVVDDLVVDELQEEAMIIYDEL